MGPKIVLLLVVLSIKHRVMDAVGSSYRLYLTEGQIKETKSEQNPSELGFLPWNCRISSTLTSSGLTYDLVQGKIIDFITSNPVIFSLKYCRHYKS